MAEYLVNNNQDMVKDSLKYVISEKTLRKFWENQSPKLTYGLLQTLFSAINESSFWTSSDIISPIKLISDLTEEQVRRILQQPNNFKKKNKQCTLKKPDFTETYPEFILFQKNKIGKICIKFGITLDTINNYQSNNVLFSLTNGHILEIDEYWKKSHLSNTHFADIVNHLSLGNFEFDRC